MGASVQLRQLESRISDLQNQHQRLHKERQQEIAILISTIDLAHLDDKTLVGGLLFLKEKITTQDPTGLALLEAWYAAGEKFQRRAKPQTRSRIPLKENIHPKKLQRLKQHINRLKNTFEREA
ncbi:MAG: hypothetical protein H0X26_07810 [Alphaproteobacteria bacterium]|nr:hypothetical protein [Alphaproteobacteria bacterium]